MAAEAKADGENDGKVLKFISDYASAIKDKFKNSGTLGVAQYITERLDEWKSIPLNIAVIGRSGVGKSTFINAIMGLRSGEEGSATSDVVQGTVTPTSYKYPGHNNFLLWDLPGVGTEKIKRADYLQKIEFERYDFFLLLSKDRFTEDDLWLAMSLKNEKKIFFFVRTNIDTSIRDYNRGQVQPKPQIVIMTRIRKDILDGLKAITDAPVFLIDSYEPRLYEFNALSIQLIHKAASTKRVAMIFSMSVLTREVIDEKKKALQERVCGQAAISGFAGAVPIPGVGTVTDIALLLREALMYRKQFGLHEEGLGQLAKQLNIPVADLTASLQLKSTAISFTTKGMVMLVREKFATEASCSLSKYVIPVIGSMMSAGVSFWSTKIFLESLIDLMYADAIKIHDYLIERLESAV